MHLWRTVQVTIATLTATDNGPSDKVELTVTRVIWAAIHFLLISMWVTKGNFMGFRHFHSPLLHSLEEPKEEVEQELLQERLPPSLPPAAV